MKEAGFTYSDTDKKWSKTFTGLPFGTYEVTETNTDVPGYTFTRTGSTTSGSGKISATENAEVNLVDKYTKNPTTGSLSITKSIDGENLTQSEFESALKFQVKTTVNGETKYVDKDGQLVDTETSFTMKEAGFTYSDTDKKWSKTFTGLPFGTYEVTETNTDVPGYTFTRTGSTTSGSGKISATENAEVNLVDNYTKNPNTYKLTVTKTVEANTGAILPRDYSFKVKNSAGKYVNKATDGTITYVEAGNATTFTVNSGSNQKTEIEGLVQDTYTVEEVTDGVTVSGYSWNAETATSNPSVTTVTADLTQSDGRAALINRYTRLTGDLDITKAIAVTGNAPANMNAEQFNITVTLSDTSISGTYGDLTFTNGVANAVITNGATITATGLPTLITYTVTEADLTSAQTQAGYVKGNNNNSGTIAEGKNSVVVDNTYTEPQNGALNISKTVNVTGETPADLADKEFEVTVTLSDTTINGEYGAATFTNGVATVYIKNGETKAITGLPTNSITAEVVESDASNAFANYTYDSTNSVTEVKNLTINSSGAVQANLVNEYTQDKGVLKLVKTIEGPVTEQDLKGLTFTVTREDGSSVGDYILGRDFVKNNDGNYELTLDVPVNTTYNVVETLYDFDNTKICTVSYKVGDGDFKDGDSVTGVSVSKGNTTTVTYKNAYQQIHTVKISKAEIVDGPEIEGAKLKLTKNTVDGEVVKEWTSTSTPTEFELTEGTYVLTETLLPDEYHVQAESVTFKVDANGGITITEGSTQAGKANAEVSSTDAKKLVMIDDLGGILRITVQEEDTNRLVPGAEVKVTTVKPDGTKETKTYTTDSEGKIRITNLPASNEYSYEVTKVPEGYKVTTDGSKTAVAVEKGKETKELEKIKPKEVTPADDTKTGTLIITVLDEQTKQPVPNATVTVKNPDGTTNTYTTDENGKITITKLPAGDYKITVTKVPDGYTVTTGKEETATVEVGKTTEHTALISTKTTPGTTPSSTPNQTTPGTTPNPKAPDQPAKTTVNTGDRVFVIPVIVLMVLSLIALVVIIIRKRKMRKEY